MNTAIAIKLARAAIEVLRHVPPVVPPSDAPLASVLTSRKLKLSRGFRRLITQRIRNAYRNLARLHVRH